MKEKKDMPDSVFFSEEETGNRRYKDTVFRMLFREKRELLRLYNAMNGSTYSDPEMLEIVTLENAVYMSMKNDLAFLADFHLYLYEHQSTVNPNLPLRFLQYVAKEYEKLIDGSRVYGRRRIMLPEPQFVVFYNGTEQLPERMELRLSESYLSRGDKKTDKLPELFAAEESGDTEQIAERSAMRKADRPEQLSEQFTTVQSSKMSKQTELPVQKENGDKEPKLELRVQVWNINAGNNEELKAQCQSLNEYMLYVDRVRKKAEMMPVGEAVARAVEECIREGILADFLQKNRAEVVPMSIYEYDEEAVVAVIREEEFEFGMAQGLAQGLTQAIGLMIEACGEWKISWQETAAKIKEKFSLDEDETQSYMEKYWKREAE